MQQYLEAGKVVTTHGVRGEMKLELWCDGVDFLKKTGRLYASAKGGKCYNITSCLLYTSPSPRDAHESRMPSSA